MTFPRATMEVKENTTAKQYYPASGLDTSIRIPPTTINKPAQNHSIMYGMTLAVRTGLPKEN